jgi:hypothetical protein
MGHSDPRFCNSNLIKFHSVINSTKETFVIGGLICEWKYRIEAVLVDFSHLPDRRCRFRFYDFAPLSFVVLVSRVGQGTQLSERSAPGCPNRQHRLRELQKSSFDKAKSGKHTDGRIKDFGRKPRNRGPILGSIDSFTKQV